MTKYEKREWLSTAIEDAGSVRCAVYEGDPQTRLSGHAWVEFYISDGFQTVSFSFDTDKTEELQTLIAELTTLRDKIG